MIPVIRKYTVPLALLLAVFFFVGVTCSTAALANQSQIERCCDKDEAPKVPVDKGECFDCNCLSCQFVIHKHNDQIKQLIATKTAYSWLLSTMTPSGFIHSIDYPPETV